ncbi:methyltransferase domain-containing protein [Knoellia koreensis]|uniref:methyltransferase domain-containing protein n=1 Tax=Knoellia koreensis TaxID=2730921 RepID=UPI00197FC780
MTTPLTLTGERTGPGIWHENYWFRRHEVAYAAVPGFVAALTSRAPSTVLDAGSGEGYAAELLGRAWPGSRVVGVDYDAAATAHAARAHAGEHAAYLRGALTALPVADAMFDVTVSMQVLEHIWTPEEFVRELARVTRPGGALVLSTPNRLTFSPGLGRREVPANAYHCREYDATELAGELARWLPGAQVTLHGVHHGGRLTDWAQAHGPVEEALAAAQPAGWPAVVRALVESVTAQDFALGEASDDCLDLVAVVANPARTVRG